MLYRKIDAHAKGRENREEIRVLWRGGGGDKDFWPEYLPLIFHKPYRKQKERENSFGLHEPTCDN